MGSMATQPVTLMTEEEYLRKERSAKFKCEFVGGEMFAMPGGTPKHSMLEANTVGEFRAQLRGKRCRARSSEMRVRTPLTGDQLYPDVSVACGPVQLYPGSNDMMVNPVVIVEVLSPSTASYDRGAKFELYKQFPTLRDYLLIHQNSIFVEHHSKSSDGTWARRDYRGGDARIPLPEIECELHLGSIYDGVMDEPD